MIVIDRRARFARAPECTKRSLLQLSIASAVATGLLVATPVVDARTTKLEITSRVTAFGGYSFAGVGQYERIVGIAYGEVDPTDPKSDAAIKGIDPHSGKSEPSKPGR